jgi:hypothetical protein
MASRQRKTTERFSQYRANLKTEQKAIDLKLTGRWFYRLTVTGSKMVRGVSVATFAPMVHSKS